MAGKWQDCSLCSKIPEYLHIDRIKENKEFPEETKKFERISCRNPMHFDSSGSHDNVKMSHLYVSLWKCTECGTYYKNWTETGYTEDDIYLERTSPDEQMLIAIFAGELVDNSALPELLGKILELPPVKAPERLLAALEYFDPSSFIKSLRKGTSDKNEKVRNFCKDLALEYDKYLSKKNQKK